MKKLFLTFALLFSMSAVFAAGNTTTVNNKVLTETAKTINYTLEGINVTVEFTANGRIRRCTAIGFDGGTTYVVKGDNCWAKLSAIMDMI